MKVSWIASIVALMSAGAGVAEPPPPLDAYGKLPAIEAIQISPDGKRLAFIATNGDSRFLAVSDVETNKILVRVPTGTRKVIAVHWLGSNNVIGSVERDVDAGWWIGGKAAVVIAAAIDIDKQRVHPLIDVNNSSKDGSTTVNEIYGEPQIRILGGKAYAFAQGENFVYHVGYLSLFRYDATIGESWLARRGDAETIGWLVGEDGEPLAQEIYNDDTQRWAIRTRMNGGFATAISGQSTPEMPSIVGLSRDGKSTLVAIMVDDDAAGRRGQLVELRPDQSSWSAPVLKHIPDEMVFDPTTEHFIGAGDLEGDAWDYVFFDAADQKRWTMLTKAYAGSNIRVRSMSADHQRWVVSVDSPVEGQAYALVDFATGKTQWIGNDYDAPNRYLSDKKPIAFKAADGMGLSGYLTLPRGADPKALPLVVFPHGGPAARDEPGFDWWAQAMASRGYAVLQVNYRGSDGYGWKHLSAGFGQWGRKMQTDLSDGVRYLAKEGTIDPKRVCIVGASYGGYAALAGATLETGVYRCAVSVAGVSDLRRLARFQGDRGGKASKAYILRFLGTKTLSDPALDEISPLRHVDKVSIPVLLIHGKDDSVVDFSQSELMYEALEREGKDVQLIALPHEDHWLLSGVTRAQMLQATMDFLLKNNPPA